MMCYHFPEDVHNAQSINLFLKFYKPWRGLNFKTANKLTIWRYSSFPISTSGGVNVQGQIGMKSGKIKKIKKRLEGT